MPVGVQAVSAGFVPSQGTSLGKNPRCRAEVPSPGPNAPGAPRGDQYAGCALDQAAIVAITGQRGVITYVDDKFWEISTYGRDELIGQDHRIVLEGREGGGAGNSSTRPACGNLVYSRTSGPGPCHHD
jgi:hypothetical protein